MQLRARQATALGANLVWPKKRSVLMTAFDGAAPDRASAMVLDALRASDPDLDIIWAGALGHECAADVVPWGSARHVAAHGRARAWVTTHSTLPRRRGGPVVQLWHGVPVKALGLDNVSLEPSLRRWVARIGRDWDVVPSPSAFYDEHVCAALGVKESAILRTGLPRYDRLGELLALRDPGGHVLYAPTVRGGHDLHDLRFDPLQVLRTLDRDLDPDQVIRYRPHYYVPSVGDLGMSDRVVIDRGQEDAIYAVAGAALVITDYSSILVDAAVLGVPTVVHAPDLDTYRLSPGLNIDLEDVATGSIDAARTAVDGLGPSAWSLGERASAALRQAAGNPAADQMASVEIAERLSAVLPRPRRSPEA